MIGSGAITDAQDVAQAPLEGKAYLFTWSEVTTASMPYQQIQPCNNTAAQEFADMSERGRT
jgi:hypothetical protein